MQFLASKPTALLAAVLWFGFKAPHAVVQTVNLSAQRANLTQVGQALSRVVVKAKKVNEKLGYGFYEGGCLFGVKLRPGRQAVETFSLQAGQSYVFIGSGDKTARNVDLVLRDASGHVVSQDIEADAAPFVLFQPQKSGHYALSLNLKSGWKGPAFCAVTILRKGGPKVPLERIVEAAIRLDYSSFEAFKTAAGGRINELPGTWGLYGAVLKQGQTLSTSPQRYGAVQRGILAVGDSRVRDLDLVLTDGTRKSLATDAKNGASPKIISKTDAGTYALKLSNRGSTGPALVMAVLLDLPAPSAPKPATVPEATATPIPQVETAVPPGMPFEGEWKGDIIDDKKGRDGAFTLRVLADGTVSGHLAYRTLKVAAKFKGTIDAQGVFHLTYTQSKRESAVEGLMKFTEEGPREAQGTVSFSTGETVLGRAEFLLVK